jgi:hypothetical protein
MKEKAERGKAELERQRAAELLTLEMQRAALEKEIDEINREAEVARDKQKAAYEKQIAERVEPNYTYGYDDPNGDRFTRGLTAEELHTRKIALQAKMDEIY